MAARVSRGMERALILSVAGSKEASRSESARAIGRIWRRFPKVTSVPMTRILMRWVSRGGQEKEWESLGRATPPPVPAGRGRRSVDLHFLIHDGPMNRTIVGVRRGKSRKRPRVIVPLTSYPTTHRLPASTRDSSTIGGILTCACTGATRHPAVKGEQERRGFGC